MKNTFKSLSIESYDLPYATIGEAQAKLIATSILSESPAYIALVNTDLVADINTHYACGNYIKAQVILEFVKKLAAALQEAREIEEEQLDWFSQAS